ncbi:MAG TPA: hypothetical protein VF619_09750 [Allosphingosinicella sp.]|jgi:hypothetical protein
MKKLAAALVAFALAVPAVSAAQDIAPPVKRKPAATSTAPVAAPAAAPATPAAPRQAGRPANASDTHPALVAAAAQDGGDPSLDASLVRVMSRLVAAGRCGEAAGLASRDGRKELASRAQQLCK